LLFPNLYGQWYYSLYLESEFNSNPFGVPEPQEDQLSRISMGLQKDWENVSAQYYGSFINYQKNAERNFFWHQFYVGGGEKTGWNLSFENRINRENFNIYDYLTARFALNHSIPHNSSLWRLNGNISLNNFLEIPELNNLFMSAYTSLNRSFFTKTSLNATMAFNYKYYLKEDIPEDPADSTVNSIKILEIAQQGGGQGPGMGGGGQGGFYYTSSQAEIPQAAQLFISVRIAQSVTRSTGIALQYSNRMNLNSYDRSIAGLVPGYNTESQIFDDPMSYEAQIYGLELTQLLPLRISVRGAAYFQEKQYVAQGIFLDPENFSESVLREDTYNTFWITLEKRFNFKLFSETSMALQAFYQWIKNDSNSYWYNYTSQFISISLQLDI